MAYATTLDVEVELGRAPSSSAESGQWSAWLDRVERIIVLRFLRAGLTLTDEVTKGAVTIDDLADVEVAAVIRKINNPDGITSVTRSVDDGSITARRDGASAGDPLEVTDEEWARLLPAFERAAWSTRPGFAPDCAPGTWTTPTDYSWT